MLGATNEQQNQQTHFQNGMGQIGQQWTLPHGKKTDGCLAALDVSLLDSLTFHAKKNINVALNQYLQNRFNQFNQFASPALVGKLLFFDKYLYIKYMGSKIF